MNKAAIYLENGIFIEATSFGANGTTVGEIVFNTSMTGYQEIISDPSYAGQFITFTATEIGNVGTNDDDNESRGVYAKAVLVKNYQSEPSNFRSTESLSSYLKKHNILGICDLDTRALTKIIRTEGAMMAIASTEIFDKDKLAEMLKNSPRIEEINWIKEVSSKEAYKYTQSAWNEAKFKYDTAPKADKTVVAIDFGAKLNILNELCAAGLNVEVVPHSVKADDLISRFKDGKINGIFLSNGPGDPLTLKDEVAEIKKLIAAKIPMFGICLGHQLLSIAHDYPTYKLKFGHHGGNHPVKNIASGAVEITAQNHNYNVPDEILKIAEITHINLFDNTIEGLKYKDEPIFSVQYHPESSPGPHESKYLFKQFAASL
ncbi:MAG: glutamine-hydrolyzing carbamoyl-phosphate synthase small subunit [Pseudomonadota bacterium]|jgi:carbamoyl-phosphate synthase small subunit